MKAYLELLRDILDNGVDKSDRTGTGTRSVFGRQFRHDLSAGFPLLTTKKLHFKSIANELIWFLQGDTNTQWLRDNGVSIWDEWATEEGDLGPIYGAQWRNWPTKDGGSIKAVSIRPGAIAFTRILGANSVAKARVKLMMPALATP